jgi:transcriptional regulator with XRE-family HTH domain
MEGRVPFSGPRLARIRVAAGLTQRQLAIAVNSGQGRVSEWERGVAAPHPSFIPALAAALGMDALEFLATDPAAPTLEDLRLAAGLSMHAISEASGISLPRYRRIEIGATRRDPPTGVVDILARLFAVPVVTVQQAVAVSKE